MGSCTRRHFLLSICVLQLLTIIERQVFDFLGYMWAPILANFFHIIFVIFGFFGAYQLRAKYLITYSVWNVLWIGWNVFLICFYLNVGVLDRDSDILNIGTGSVSWFEVNGFGCKPVYPTNITSEDPYRPVRPESVDGCVLDYFTIEIIHAAVQLLFTVLGLIGAIFVSRIFLDEDDRFDFMGGDAKSPQHTVVHPMYVSYTSIPTSASAAMTSKLSNNIANVNNNLRSNNSNTNSMHSLYNSNRRNSHTSCISRPEIRYTELSTDQLVTNFDPRDNNFAMHNMKTFHQPNHQYHLPPHNNHHQAEPSTRSSMVGSTDSNFAPHIRTNPNFYGYDNSQAIADDSYDDNHTIIVDEYNNSVIVRPINSSSGGVSVAPPFIPSHRSNNHRGSIISQAIPMTATDYNRNHPPPSNYIGNNNGSSFVPHSVPEVDEDGGGGAGVPPDNNYVMPYQYVTRSPNLNRSGSRRRNDQRPQIVNYCDQIRDAPPGYSESVYIQRAKSFDRLAHRNRRSSSNGGRGAGRPRSFCSNGGYPENF